MTKRSMPDDRAAAAGGASATADTAAGGASATADAAAGRAAASADGSPVLFAGALSALADADRARLFDRGRATDPAVERDVRAIIADVRARGDTALRELAARFDGARLSALEVAREDCDRALASLEPQVRAALELAAQNIAAFHRAQLPAALEIETMPGVRLGRRVEPIQRVGVYAPGGRAAYPSSVLMGVVPAKVAGVGEVVVCSPAGPDGRLPAAVLAACALAGADSVFALGGAGAIAALALGTDSVPRVDKIVGPGNAYVTEAKRQLAGAVAIDSPAGPSEVLIVADDTADPLLVAIEMLAQAEHDPDAAAVLVTTDGALMDSVAAEVARLIRSQPRADIIRAALASRGALLRADTMQDAAAFAALYAPEHLLVMTRDPRALLPALRNAGTIFLGASSSVAFGDYLTGANHVLPTAGLARAHSGLTTADFIRWTTCQELTPAAAAALAGPTAALARVEGLPAHAMAAQLRAGNAPTMAAGATRAAGAAPPARAAASDALRAAPVRLRAAYESLELYDPGRLPCAIDLSDNTNLFGPAPAVRRSIADTADDRITRYPSVYANDLRAALAKLHGVAPENIATGCGSDDVIDSALRAFCEPNDIVAYPDPTFGMIPIFGRMNALSPIAVPLREEFALDADALIQTGARITYLCRPNNPTGTQFDRSATERVCRSAAGVVLVDEAYGDYADDDLASYAVASDRTLVLRTLSKAYGLAGLRVGYAIGPARLIAEVEKSRGPYKVNGVAESAALAALGERKWVEGRIAEVRASRTRLLAAVASRGIRAWDSAANFVLMSVPGSAAEWNLRLREHGVAVRPFAALPHAGDCIRVSTGPWPMLERFLTATDDVLDKMARHGA